jgi:glutamate--cysteine ligase
MVPHFVTALSGPLQELEERMINATPKIERWFRMEWQEHTPPFYASVDLRNAGYKLAPVDMNLFPGGFNNLSDSMLPLAVQAAMAAIEKYCPDARNLILIPENDTRNMFYLSNVLRLAAILRQTGLNVRFGSIDPEVVAPTTLTLPDQRTLLLEPLERHGRRAGLPEFDPCAILLNNDLSAGLPQILQGLNEQVLLPPLHAGWAVRKKSNHFAAYNDVAKRFAKLIDIDPWLINPYFEQCGQINFQQATGIDCLASATDSVLKQMRSKYKEYGIVDEPFVIVKADAGTYGMGVMTVKDSSELRNLNGKQRNKMAVIKDGLEVRDVIIQEGVRTIETLDEGVAEPVVVMIDRYVVGGFYRVNAERGTDENLNTPSMHFKSLSFATPCHMPDCGEDTTAAPNRFYAYGVVARLALLAASLELERTDPDQTLYG